MNHKLDQSIARLGGTSRIRRNETKSHLSSAVRESVDELEARGKNALERLEAKREHAASAKEKVLRYLEEKKGELVAKYEDWRTDREIEKPERTADAKE